MNNLAPPLRRQQNRVLQKAPRNILSCQRFQLSGPNQRLTIPMIDENVPNTNDQLELNINIDLNDVNTTDEQNK